MSLSAVFIQRPVATWLLTLALALAGVLAFFRLPIAPLPQVEFPTLSVTASLPGASPETMAATVATPLERALGAIAGVTEITSSSSQGSTRVTLQFELERDIDAAARDVQAAIQAARTLLPTGMPAMPQYRKVNPADMPVLILALTSETYSRGQMYDAASTVLAQRLAQIEGVGQVNIGGGALPAVRIAVDARRAAAMGVSLQDVRVAVTATNANRPKGMLDDGSRTWHISANDQARSAADYAPLIVRYRNGSAVRLSDIAEVSDSVQDARQWGMANGRPAIILMVYKAPGANIIRAVDQVHALLPELRASIPAGMQLEVVSDRTPTIRASLREMEHALALATGLVVLVVFVFLRRIRAALIPSVAVPVSLAGTLALMHLLGYSLDILSLMALTVATGFVVDDAIVVLEHISRHIERGKSALEAALDGAREIGPTVLSMSLSLVAAFIPIWLMGGVVGRLFHEFAVVLSAAIAISLLVSLSTTPMMCAVLLRPAPAREHPAAVAAPQPALGQRAVAMLARASAAVQRRWTRTYQRSLVWCVRHGLLVLLALAGVIALNVSLYRSIDKGFFPTQDTGRIGGFVRADQATSFAAMQQRLQRLMAIVQADPAVLHVTGFTGGGQRNTAQMFMSLKPRSQRSESAEQVIERLRRKLAQEPGARLFLFQQQDIRIGARQTSTSYQYTLQADELQELRQWEPQVRRALQNLPEITDVDTDRADSGLQTTLQLDRDALARHGLSMRQVSNALNDAYAQRPISVIYNPLNQYRVVLEIGEAERQSPEQLRDLPLLANGQLVPLPNLGHSTTGVAPLSVSHEAGTPAATISFELPSGGSLSAATEAITDAVARLGLPVSVRGSFSGTAKGFKATLSSQPVLILAALVTVYIILGVLYESLIHPLTILSTLPSAGVGALLALMAFGKDFSLIALIGVILLIGIVKKNAILMIDVALSVQRRSGCGPAAAIVRAARLRLRPILMTTAAAILGALPLALGQGDGAELRQPLGIAIVGGLLLSQLLTLYTTPVVYVALDRLRRKNARPHSTPRPAGVC